MQACKFSKRSDWEDNADGFTEKSTTSLWYLLCLPPIRRRVLDFLSAFDAAKLHDLQLCILSASEKKRYLKPLRDLVWNIHEAEGLLEKGMKLTLLGDSASALEERLHATDRYLNSHGNGRLAVHLLGTFVVSTPTAATLDELVNFSTTGQSSPVRSYGDKYQLGRVRALTEAEKDRIFVMSFSTPMQASANSAKGSWCRVDNVPDRTIDLWVYVPSFRDRIHEEIRIAPKDLVRILGALPVSRPVLWFTEGRTFPKVCEEKLFHSVASHIVLRFLRRLSALSKLFTICTGRFSLSTWSLTIAGVRPVTVNSLSQLDGDAIAAQQLLPQRRVYAFGFRFPPRGMLGHSDAPTIRIVFEIIHHATVDLGMTVA